jgi:hypothetical protein
MNTLFPAEVVESMSAQSKTARVRSVLRMLDKKNPPWADFKKLITEENKHIIASAITRKLESAAGSLPRGRGLNAVRRLRTATHKAHGGRRRSTRRRKIGRKATRKSRR